MTTEQVVKSGASVRVEQDPKTYLPVAGKGDGANARTDYFIWLAIVAIAVIGFLALTVQKP